MDNNRIASRPSLGGENTLDRPGIQGIGAEAVDRLRGKSHESARAKCFRRTSNGGGIRINRIDGQDDGGHALILPGAARAMDRFFW